MNSTHDIAKRQEIMQMAKEAGISPVNDDQIKFEGPMWLCLERFAKAIEAKLKEKNT